jgi:hypothetical protein
MEYSDRCFSLHRILKQFPVADNVNREKRSQLKYRIAIRPFVLEESANENF